MHTNRDWQAAEVVLSKVMATISKYLQTWKLNLSTTKILPAVFHLNNKEAKRQLNVYRNNEILPFCREPKYLGVMLDRSLTYRRQLKSLRKKLTSRVTFLRWLAGSGLWLRCWNNNVANSHLSPGPINNRVLRSCLVPQCSYPPHWPSHQRRFANCDWMPALYTSGLPFYSRKHPICWASSQWSHTVSSTPCHRAWTSAPPNAHLSTECKCTVPQIETPICTRRTTAHHSVWRQQYTCGSLGGSPMECGVDGQP